MTGPVYMRVQSAAKGASLIAATALFSHPAIFPGGSSTPPVWPASGIALAGLLLMGPAAWPAVALGSLLASALTGRPAGVALVSAAGASIAAVAGTLLLRLGRCDRSLARIADVLQFIVLGAMVSSLLSTMTFALSTAVQGGIPWSALPGAALGRWLAEVLGVLGFGSLVLTVAATPRRLPALARLVESCVLVAVLLAVTHIVYGGLWRVGAEQPFAFTTFPFLIWAVLRFEQRDAIGVTVLGVVAALWESGIAGTLVTGDSVTKAIVLSQTSMAVVMLTTLILSAAIAERRRMQTELLRGQANLESTVQERTRQLQEELAERHRIEDALHRYEFIVNTSGEMMTLISRDYVYDAVNNWFCKSHGRTRADTVGMPVAEVWGAEVFEQYIKMYLDRCFAGENVRYQAWLPFRQAGRRCVEVSYTPYRNGSQQITHAVVVSWDVTEREQMAEHLVKLSRAVEQSPVSIVITDTHGDIEYVNQRFVRSTGYAREEVLGRNSRLLKSGETPPEEYRRLWTTITAGGEWRGEFHNRRKNGDLFWEFASISPIRSTDGQITHFLAVKEDITARKQLERELVAKNTELEQIVYVTSHDLRSPLVNIQGFSKELEGAFHNLHAGITSADMSEECRGRVVPILERDIPEAFSYVFASTRKMDSLIDGLLRLSRLGRATLILRPVDMNAMLASVLQTFEFVIKQRGVTVVLRPLPTCRGDELQINQLFSNLIDNALKYLDPGRPGKIIVDGTTDGHMARYRVGDNGIGIDPQHAERIFDIFHRLHPDMVEGEGLGLTMARKIVDRQAGSIRVESTPGRGSTFHVALPAAADLSGGTG